MKSHFVTLEPHICAVVGMNGWVWLYYDPLQDGSQEAASFDLKKTAAMQLENLYESSQVQSTSEIPTPMREKLAAYRNHISGLNNKHLTVSLISILEL